MPRRVSTGCATASLCIALAACEPRPVELGFWMEPVSYGSPRLGGDILSHELDTIDGIARAEIERAFGEFEVTVTENRRARFRVVVLPELKDHRLRRTGSHAGESRAVSGFGGSGSVNFDYVANGAMVFAPEDAGRDDIIAALGRGIGRVAIHEFAHQLLPKSALHDGRDPNTYEGNSPARIDGYYGDLRWDIAAPWLDARLKRR